MIGKDNGIIIEERGAIFPVADDTDHGYSFKSVMLIESKKGSIRANHYHKDDSHIMYIISGKARYVEIHDDKTRSEEILGDNDKVFTAANVPHAMEFLEDTLMVVCTKNPRDYETYMADIVKVEIL